MVNTFALMTTGVFSQKISKLFSELKLRERLSVTYLSLENNLLNILFHSISLSYSYFIPQLKHELLFISRKMVCQSCNVCHWHGLIDMHIHNEQVNLVPKLMSSHL